MTYTLVISPEAKQDIIAILAYTENKWGIAQTDEYAAKLDKGLALLTENPLIGRSRSDISLKHRSFLIEKHIAVYFVEADTVYLSRLLHHSRDIMQHITIL